MLSSLFLSSGGVLLAVLFSALPVAGQTADAAATGDEPTFAAGVETVVVDVVVTMGTASPSPT